jgi:hypothetical protein
VLQSSGQRIYNRGTRRLIASHDIYPQDGVLGEILTKPAWTLPRIYSQLREKDPQLSRQALQGTFTWLKLPIVTSYVVLAYKVATKNTAT